MSDSDLLGIIARNPLPKKQIPSRFRPVSPKVITSKPATTHNTSPSPPESPNPMYKNNFADDQDLNESASMVAEQLHRDRGSPGSDSVLLDVMRNDDESVTPVFYQDQRQSLKPHQVLPINRFKGPVRAPEPGLSRLRNYADGWIPTGIPMMPTQPEIQPDRPTSPSPDDPRMQEAARELRQKRDKLLSELALKRAKGYDIPSHLGNESSVEELNTQVEIIRRLENHKRTVSMLRYLMVIGCTGVEKATMAMMKDVYLDGWSESIAANQDDYNDVVGRIADTMDLSTSIPPQIELVVMLGVSGVLFHMSKKNRVGLVAASDPTSQQHQSPPRPAQSTRPADGEATAGARELTEEQLRIHDLLTNGAVKTPREYQEELGKNAYDHQSVTSDRSYGGTKSRKRPKIAIDSDEIVRLF